MSARRELLAAATPRPWSVDVCWLQGSEDREVAEFFDDDQGITDISLAALAVNEYEALLDIAEAAGAVFVPASDHYALQLDAAFARLDAIRSAA